MEPSEIYFLLKLFKELNPDNEYKISNNQLLQTNFLKHCPFRKNLIYAFGLKQEDFLDNNENHLSSNKKKINIGNLYDDNVMKEKFNVNSIINEVKSKHIAETAHNNYIYQDDKDVVNIFHDVNTQEITDLPTRTDFIIGKRTITFPKYCDVMKVFNWKASIDDKIKCKKIIII